MFFQWRNILSFNSFQLIIGCTFVQHGISCNTYTCVLIFVKDRFIYIGHRYNSLLLHLLFVANDTFELNLIAQVSLSLRSNWV